MRTKLSVNCGIAGALVLFVGCAPVGMTPLPVPAATAVVTNPAVVGTPTSGLTSRSTPVSIPITTPTPGTRNEAPSLTYSLDKLTAESTEIFIGTPVRLLEERVNTHRVGAHGENEDPTFLTLRRQYEVVVERYLKGDAGSKVVLIKEEEKTKVFWQTPGRPEHWQEYVPGVTPVQPTIGQRYLFFARPWGWGVFPEQLLSYKHPSHFSLQGGVANVEDEYFVGATKDKYYPSKPETEFLAEVQAAIARNPTKIADLVGSPGYTGQ